MAVGTVEWFDSAKRYGFIQPDVGGTGSVFVHMSAVEQAGLSTLVGGQRVNYEIVTSKGRASVADLQLIDE